MPYLAYSICLYLVSVYKCWLFLSSDKMFRTEIWNLLDKYRQVMVEWLHWRLNARDGWIGFTDRSFFIISHVDESEQRLNRTCAITPWCWILLLFDHYHHLPSVFLHISDSSSVRSHLFGKLLTSFLRLQMFWSFFSPAATCVTS